MLKLITLTTSLLFLANSHSIEAQLLSVPISHAGSYSINGQPQVTLVDANANFDLHYFTQYPFAFHVMYTDDQPIGQMLHGVFPGGVYNIYGHGSIVIKWVPNTNTMQIATNKAHITSWYPYQQRFTANNQVCRIYYTNVPPEECDCGTNPNWFICGVENWAYGMQQNFFSNASEVEHIVFNKLVELGYKVEYVTQ